MMELMASIQVTLEIPEDLTSKFGSDPEGLSRAALEGLAIEGLRTEKLTVSQARRLLGIGSRYEMDGFLKAHNLLLDLTLEDVRNDSVVAGAFKR
jgi:hypothetical protein